MYFCPVVLVTQVNTTVLSEHKVMLEKENKLFKCEIKLHLKRIAVSSSLGIVRSFLRQGVTHALIKIR